MNTQMYADIPGTHNNWILREPGNVVSRYVANEKLHGRNCGQRHLAVCNMVVEEPHIFLGHHDS